MPFPYAAGPAPRAGGHNLWRVHCNLSEQGIAEVVKCGTDSCGPWSPGADDRGFESEHVGQVANLSYAQHCSGAEKRFRGALMGLLEGRAVFSQHMGTVDAPAGGGGIVPRSGEVLGCAQMDDPVVGVRHAPPDAC